MSRIVLGVMGHVDHGKTALVHALTGMHTDRLAEEQARGISIALGFAHVRVGEHEADLIDMPGHERFVRTMVSGATGIDAMLLVVDAARGVMPQTREHVDVARLLGVRRALAGRQPRRPGGAGQGAAGRSRRRCAAGGFRRGGGRRGGVFGPHGQGVTALRDAIGRLAARAATSSRLAKRQACARSGGKPASSNASCRVAPFARATAKASWRGFSRAGIDEDPFCHHNKLHDFILQ